MTDYLQSVAFQSLTTKNNDTIWPTVKVLRLRHSSLHQINFIFFCFYENKNIKNKKEIVSSYYEEKMDSR